MTYNDILEMRKIRIKQLKEIDKRLKEMSKNPIIKREMERIIYEK